MTCIQNSKRRADSALNPRKRESRTKCAPQYGFSKRTKISSALDQTGTTPDTNQTQISLAEEFDMKTTPTTSAEGLFESKFIPASTASEIPVNTLEGIPHDNIGSEQNAVIFGSNSSSILPSFDALNNKMPEGNEQEAERVQTDGEASAENTDNDDMLLSMRVAVDVDSDPQQKKKYKLKQRKPKSNQ